jgi:hypothetical protein
MFTKEALLLEPVMNFFRRRDYRRQVLELQFFEYRIDIFGYSQKEQLTTAIELKLAHWRRAFDQALIYQLCADFSYIAMPENKVGLVNLELLRSEGIGLVAVRPDPRCRIILKAENMLRTIPKYRDFYVNLIRRKSHANT